MNEHEIVEDCNSVEDFLIIARSLGEIIRHHNGDLYDVVVANNGLNAKTGTFSQKFGFAAFPLHTDTAFWATPARFLVMWSPKASTTPTTILAWKDILNLLPEKEIKAINNAIFTVNTFENVSYRSIKFDSHGVKGFRYDPNIMLPANEEGKKFEEIFHKTIKSMSFIDVNWSGSNALLLNNWNMLHGRKQVKNKHEVREIFRVYVR